MAKVQKGVVGRQSRPEYRRQQENYWRQILKEQAKSGLTQSEFCRRRSIPPHRYYWWKRKISVRSKSPPEEGADVPKLFHFKKLRQMSEVGLAFLW